jgi:hypothetical protein
MNSVVTPEAFSIMNLDHMQPSILSNLRSVFGDHMQENVPLSSYTGARIGGPADVMVFVHS